MPAKPTRTPSGDAVFLAALQAGLSVRSACAEAGYARSCVYAWRRGDGAFASAWNRAIYAALAVEADRRLRERYERPIFVQGEIVGYRQVCPDQLLFERYDALWGELRALQATCTNAAPLSAATPARRRRLARWFGWVARHWRDRSQAKGQPHAG